MPLQNDGLAYCKLPEVKFLLALLKKFIYLNYKSYNTMKKDTGAAASDSENTKRRNFLFG